MRASIVAWVLFVAAILPFACTKENPRYCVKDDDCGPTGTCDVVAKECRIGGGGEAGTPPDRDSGAGGGGADAGVIPARDGEAPDKPEPDAQVGCANDQECARKDPMHPVCENRICVGCIASAQCKPDWPICGPSKRCLACTSDAECKSLGDPARAFCETGTGRCVQCLTPAACTTAEKPICGAARSCAGCSTDMECKALGDPARTLCDMGTGRCVQCLSAAACTTAEKPICGAARTCAACASDAECKGLGDPARAFCDTGSGRCVQCLSSAACPQDKPICRANRQCGGCTSDMECRGLGKAGQEVCDMGSGRCVQCLTSANCTNAATPICNVQARTCAPCTADAECAAKSPNPGVCEGGRCATEAETIFVENRAGCSAAGGTAAMPVCALADVAGKITAGRTLVVVRGAVEARLAIPSTPGKVNVVGQRGSTGDAPSAGVGVGTAIQVTGGEISIRDLNITGGNSSASPAVDVSGIGTKTTLLRVRVAGAAGIGVRTASGAHLTMDKCTVENNMGGGVLVDGAGYAITNSVVAGPGAGVQFSTGIPAGARFQSNTVLGVVSCAPSAPQTISGSIVTGANLSCNLDRTVFMTTPDFDAARPYRLKARLPCPGGDPAMYPPDDIDGQPRRSPIDCGADQYAP